MAVVVINRGGYHHQPGSGPGYGALRDIFCFFIYIDLSTVFIFPPSWCIRILATNKKRFASVRGMQYIASNIAELPNVLVPFHRRRHPRHAMIFTYRQVSYISRTKSQHFEDSRTAMRLPLSNNPLKPDVQSGMKMQLEQRRQAMLRLHLSDRQFYCLLRCDLYWRFYGKSNASIPATGRISEKRITKND